MRKVFLAVGVMVWAGGVCVGDEVDALIGQLKDRDPMVKRETLELVRAYFKIEDDAIRKRLFEMTKALAAISRRKTGKEPEKSRRGRPRKVK